MKDNRHSTVVPPEVLAQINTLLDSALQLFEPYAITLTPDERQSLLKMGEKGLSFITKANELSAQYPALLPPYFNREDFNIDVTDTQGLFGLLVKARKLESAVNVTSMVSASEAYSAALRFYSSAQTGTKDNIVGAEVAYNALKGFFPRGKRAAKTTPE